MWRLSVCLVLALLSPMLEAQGPCAPILTPTGGWAVDLCPDDPAVTETMEVVLDGAPKGAGSLVRIYHRTQDGRRMPQVAVLYASGFVRLKQNADPDPAIPFGSSFVLGPAYWSSPERYHHHPVLSRLEIDTSAADGGPLFLRAEATQGDFVVHYWLTLPPPSDQRTRLHVTQRMVASADVTISPVRRQEGEGFKLVQVSSMFITEDGPCDGGHSGCHDSDAVRFLGADLARRERAFGDVDPPGSLFATARALGDSWVDVLHRNDAGWQGNTPNVRIALDQLPGEAGDGPGVSVQGFLTATQDPNQDNLGLWIHDDDPAVASWQAGQERAVGYWLSAQDDPPDPWADAGLRTGRTVLDFAGAYDCHTVTSAGTLGAELREIAGYTDRALQIDYDLGALPGEWAQVRCDFSSPLDLSAFDHLRLEWRGSPGASNTLEVGVIDRHGGSERVWIRGWPSATHRSWWGQLVVPFEFLSPAFDPSAVTAVFLSVKNGTDGDAGGPGSLAIDNLGALRVADRPVPRLFESAAPSPEAADAAAGWLASVQRPNGLLKSWEQDRTCFASTYTQGLALLVFSAEGRAAEADAVARALVDLQNPNGSWFQSYDCDTMAPLTGNEWLGDVAWVVFALGRHLDDNGEPDEVSLARDRAAAWLADQIDPGDGCLGIDHTEGTLDAWWALRSAGPAFTAPAAALERCLLRTYWDADTGRFKGGRSWWQPYLDNQTWGATFLDAVGRPEDARRALGFARQTLLTPGRNGHLLGFDGQGGPWSIWNEGTAQYVAAGGPGARELAQELLAQQRSDGAMPGAPDHFEGGGVWNPRWYGVAPTAWLYFALEGGPFPPFDREPLLSNGVSGFGVWSSFTAGGGHPISGAQGASCIPETLCVEGALPGRSEAFVRVVGPKPNGRLWPTVVKFSTSTMDVWVKQLDTGLIQHYRLEGAVPGSRTLPALFDRSGFPPQGEVAGSASAAGSPSAAVSSSEGAPPEPPAGPWLTSGQVPDFRFKVRISTAGTGEQTVRSEEACIPETLCVSGALPGRSEVFLRVVGPKPNGRLWPTLARFSTSLIEIWIEQVSSGNWRYYRLDAATPGSDRIDGLFDREGFSPPP